MNTTTTAPARPIATLIAGSRGIRPIISAPAAAGIPLGDSRLRGLGELCLARRDGCLTSTPRAAIERYAPPPAGAAPAPRRMEAGELRRRLDAGGGAAPAQTEAWLELAPVAPKRIAIAWLIPPEAADRVLRRLGGSAAEAGVIAFLRFFDTTVSDSLAGPFFDIPVAFAGGRGCHFQDFWAAGRAYTAELWLQRPNRGPAAPVACSRRAVLPRDAAGPCDFAPDHPDRRWRGTRAPRPETSEIDVLAELAREDALREDSPDRDVEAEAVVRALYRGLAAAGSRVLRQAPEIPYRTPEERRNAWRRRQRMRAAAPARPRRRPADRLPAEAVEGFWIRRLDRPVPPPAGVDAAMALAHPPARLDAWEAVRPLIDLRRRFDAWNPAAAAAAEATRTAPEREAVPSTRVMEEPARIPAPVEPPAGAPEAWTLKVEVVLSGRVRPGRRVRIAGRPAAVAADGTFRLALPWREGLRLPVEILSRAGSALTKRVLSF